MWTKKMRRGKISEKECGCEKSEKNTGGKEKIVEKKWEKKSMGFDFQICQTIWRYNRAKREKLFLKKKAFVEK